MGCDIHLFTEKKIKGSWVNQKNNLDVGRNYTLFSILADVRNYDDVIPICEPKGVPRDASQEYLLAVENEGLDGHSHSYLNLQELIDYLPNEAVKESGMISLDQAKRLDKGELPTSWCRATSDTSYVYREWYVPNNGLKRMVDQLQTLNGESEPTEIRIVFFFDN